MRIHTNVLTYGDLTWSALIADCDYEIERTGSRTHDRAFTVHLTGDSGRQPNRRGQNYPGTKAATWDQWGVFIAMLFAKDPSAVFGTVKYPTYRNASDFHMKTADRFAPRELQFDSEGGPDVAAIKAAYWPEDAHGDHRFKWAGIPGGQSCTRCSAVRRWDIAG